MSQSIHMANFNGYPIQIIDHNGQPWLTAEQIGRALGLKHPANGINKLYKRHADEFTDNMTCHAKMAHQSEAKETRIFSPRGAWLIAIFCQTDNAKQFRRWVLNVLEQQPQPANTTQLRALKAELLAKQHTWQKINRYTALGLNNVEIGRLIGRHPDTVRRNKKRMTQCGLLPKPAQPSNPQLPLL